MTRSIELYLDDCADSDLLAELLTNAGHHVETPRTAGLRGVTDREHLEFAAGNRLTLITKNPDDFEVLHDEWQVQERNHAGILLIYQDNILGKDMESADIVTALQNLLATGLPIDNDLHVLNHWR